MATTPRAGSRPRRRLVVESLQAYLFLLPAAAVLAVFKVWPALFAVYISTFRWDIVQGAWAGLGNYADILFGTRAGQFWNAVATTFTYAAITIPFEIGAALLISYVLFQRIAWRSLYRTIYYIPYVTATVAAATVFAWVFNPNYGPLNALLERAGIGALTWFDEPNGVFAMIADRFGATLPQWAAGPSLALVSVALFSIWHFLGFQIVIFLAGLGNIPEQYYEAAKLDGASQWQLFRQITLPLLSPQIFFVFTIASIGVLRAFDQIFVLTNGGPLDTTRTLSMLVFQTFFQRGNIGLGSAMGILLTLIILAFTLVQFRVLERRVHYT